MLLHDALVSSLTVPWFTNMFELLTIGAAIVVVPVPLNEMPPKKVPDPTTDWPSVCVPSSRMLPGPL